jgi:parallel beta-helix repeat protein
MNWDIGAAQSGGWNIGTSQTISSYSYSATEGLTLSGLAVVEVTDYEYSATGTLSTSALAATEWSNIVEVYVDPGATGAADGTSWTDAYTGLQAAETAEQRDILSEDIRIRFNCRDTSGVGDTVATRVVSWTGDSEHYIIIQGDNYSGKWDDTKYILRDTEAAPASNGLLEIGQSFTRIKNIQLELTYTGSSNYNCLNISSGDIGVIYDSCLAKYIGSPSGNNNCFTTGSGTTTDPSIVINCIAIGDSTTTVKGFNLNGSGASGVYAYNNTSIDCAIGFASGYEDCIAYNNVTYNCIEPWSGTFIGGSNNAGDTTDGPSGADTNYVDISGDTIGDLFVDYTNDDFHVQLGASLMGVGLDLSGDSNFPLLVDIEGDTRKNWDIGADEREANTIVRFVDTDTPGMTGDTGHGWNNAYDRLSYWEAAEQTNLVSDGVKHHVYCRASSGTGDTTPIIVTGWTTASPNYIQVQAASTDVALKTGWDNTRYRLDVSTDNSIYLAQNYVHLFGLQIKNTHGTKNAVQIASTGLEVDSCRITSPGSYNAFRGGTGTSSTIIINSIIDTCGLDGIRIDTSGANAEIYNCIFYGVGADAIQYDAGTTGIVKNCAVFNNANDFQDDSGGGVTISFNASDDYDGGDTVVPSSGDSDWTSDFADAANGDFTLLPDSNLLGSGTNDPGGTLFTTDMEGDTRIRWDIGADEWEPKYLGDGTVTVEGESATETDVGGDSNFVYIPLGQEIILSADVSYEAFYTYTHGPPVNGIQLSGIAATNALETIEIYVDKDSVGDSDGDSWGTAYTELATAITARATDLTAINRIHHFNVRASAGTAMVNVVSTLGSYTSDVNNYVSIEFEDHGGSFNTSTARMEDLSSSSSILLDLEYTRLIGAQILKVPNARGIDVFANNCIVEKCIIVGTPAAGSSQNGIRVDNHYATIKNNIVYNWDASGIYFAGGDSGEVYNNTAVNNGTYGIYVFFSDNNTFRNNLFIGNGLKDWNLASSNGTVSGSNYTGDTSSPDGTGDTYWNASPIFNGTSDFHLVNGDDGLFEGDSLSGIVVYDIDGDTRFVWDAGADEYAGDYYLYTPSGTIILDGIAATEYTTVGDSTIHAYVDTGATGDSDGDSWGTAWTSLSNWNDNTTPIDLITTTTNYVVHCRASNGDTDTVGLTIGDSWKGDSVYFLTIEVPQAERHNGVWDSNKYSIIPSGARTDGTLTLGAQGIHIDGLQISTSTISNANQGGIFLRSQDSDMYTKITNNIIRGIDSGGQAYINGIQQYTTGDGTLIVANNIFYGWTGAGLGTGALAIWDLNVINHIYNNTFYNNVLSIYQAGSSDHAYIYNNLSQASTNGFSFNSTYSGLYNITDSVGDTTGGDTISYGIVLFGDTSLYDYRLYQGDTTVTNIGMDLSGDSIYAFSTDIQGDSRITWYVGADEWVDSYYVYPSGTITLDGIAATEEVALGDFTYTPSGSEIILSGITITEATADYTYASLGTLTLSGISATEQSTINTSIGSGTLILDGISATEAFTYFVYTPLGLEIVLDGTSSTEATADYTYASSGTLTLSGVSATEQSTANTFIGIGGLTLTGTSSTEVTADYTYTPLGSELTLSGISTQEEFNDYIYSPSGTLTLSGISNTEQSTENEYISTGTLVLEGIAQSNIETLDYVSVPIGTITLSGIPQYQLIGQSTYSATGSLTINGEATSEEFSNDFVASSSGEIQFSGQSETNFTSEYSYNASGALLISGISETEIGFISTASGILILSGIADTDYTRDFIYLGTDGLTLSGIALSEEANTYVYDTSGTITIDGAGDVILSSSAYIYTTKGGITLNGTADTDFGNEYIGDAGLTLSGTATDLPGDYAYTYIPDGTITLDGTAQYAPTGWYYISTDGVTVGGTAQDEGSGFAFTYPVPTAGVTVNGISATSIRAFVTQFVDFPEDEGDTSGFWENRFNYAELLGKGKV